MHMMVFLWTWSLLLLSMLLANHEVESSVWFVAYPEGGDCRNHTFSDNSQQLVCITGGAIYGPSPAMIGDEIVYLGQQGEDFAFFQASSDGAVASDVTTDQRIATVRLGFNVPNKTDCFLQVDNVDCCGCKSCLDDDGNLVGMKADCTNIPNGRRVKECEPLNGYFPLDLTLNDDPSGDCNAAAEETVLEEDTKKEYSGSSNTNNGATTTNINDGAISSVSVTDITTDDKIMDSSDGLAVSNHCVGTKVLSVAVALVVMGSNFIN
jgi:hypothetical protein